MVNGTLKPGTAAYAKAAAKAAKQTLAWERALPANNKLLSRQLLNKSALKVWLKGNAPEAQMQNELSHGRPVFKLNGMYWSQDVDKHSGGFWKGATTIDNLRNTNTRSGTYWIDFTWIAK